MASPNAGRRRIKVECRNCSDCAATLLGSPGDESSTNAVFGPGLDKLFDAVQRMHQLLAHLLKAG